MTADDILNIAFPEDFGSDEDGYDTASIEEVYEQLNSSVETAYGASKFVIFINGEQVVKVPFNGYYCEGEDDNYYFNEFVHKDYCAIEEAVYEKAVEAGVGEFFASTEYYGESVNGTPIYISERVQNFYTYEDKPSISISSQEKTNKLLEHFYTLLPFTWIALAIDYYGLEKVEKFIKFVDEENICDLHGDNIGFRKDGAPVLLDYSSYLE